jgi:hypothetical protein
MPAAGELRALKAPDHLSVSHFGPDRGQLMPSVTEDVRAHRLAEGSAGDP